MATERSKLGAFLSRVRVVAPSAIVLKITDMRTAGIPDAYLAHKGRSVWIEAKHLTRRESVEASLEPIQRVTLLELSRESIRAYVLVFLKDHAGVAIYEPHDLTSPILFGISYDEAISYFLFPSDAYFAAGGRA